MTRRYAGCGYLPIDPSIPVRPWDHPDRKRSADEFGEDGKLHLPICPGYVCNLPEVIEASHAHMLMKSGALNHFCRTEPASEPLLMAMTILECEQAKVMTAASKPK